MVLASKLGSSVSLQQDKNFHQSFATWVKQGQTSSNTGKPLYATNPLKIKQQLNYIISSLKCKI